MRPIDFCKPTRTNQALCGLFDSLFSERRTRFDAGSLASVIAFVSPRSPLIDDQSGSRAPPPFASSSSTKDGAQRVSRPDSDREPPVMETPPPSAEAAFADAASSAAIAIGGDASGILVAWPSVAGRPRRGSRASSASSKGLVATIPDAFARSSAPSPSAAFAAELLGARHFVVASLARAAREASLSAGDDVHPPSPEPRFDPRLSSTIRIGARISLRASCNRVFNPRATTVFARDPPARCCLCSWPLLVKRRRPTPCGADRRSSRQGPRGSRRSTDPPSRRSRAEDDRPSLPRPTRSTSTLRRAARRREEIEISALHTSFAEEPPSRARPRSLARVFRSRVLSSKKAHRWEPFIHKLITACGWIEGPLLENASIGQ